MSRFYSTVSNNRSTQTKCGHSDGLSAHVRGWNIGARVDIKVDENGNDKVCIYKTSGSNGSSSNELIACFTN